MILAIKRKPVIVSKMEGFGSSNRGIISFKGDSTDVLNLFRLDVEVSTNARRCYILTVGTFG